MFILDPYLWALLGVAMWATIRTQREYVARIALAVVAGYILMCGTLHWLALPRHAAAKVRAYAQPLNPFRWIVVHDFGDTIEWSDGEHTRIFTQFHDEALLPRAEATDAVKLFRWFAVFPLVDQIHENGHTVLRYRDLRFRSRLPWGGVREGMFILAKVVFDKRGHVIATGLAGEER